MISIGLGVLLISFLLITNLILISISANKKEIGILKALGGSNNTIYKIYLTESMIIGFCSLIIGIALFPFLNIFLNRILCPKDYNHLQFFAQNLLALLFIILTTIIIPLFATILPIRKIVKMTPMKSIRNT
jgi:ABC-type antimicrobial peptide transport system permease subunit